MRGIEVISAGLLSTIQDSGRFGWQEYGMPTAGAMDSFALRAGNRLVGNAEDAATLEVTLLGPNLRFTHDALVAVTGATFSLKLDGATAPLWESFWVTAGQTLAFGTATTGCRGYLCIAGGFAVPQVMGSGSTYLRGNLGGHQGRKLLPGDFLPVSLPDSAGPWGRRYPTELIPTYAQEQIVRVIMGPQDDYFSDGGIATFLAGTYTVTTESDRMGYRLAGPVVEHKSSADIISDGLSRGAIQIPGHGCPIIMLSDRPTTGGYAKIATVITADLPKVTQIKPGGTVRFQAVDFACARQALVEMEAKLQGWQAPDEQPADAREFVVTLGGRRFRVTVQKAKK